MSHCGMIVDEPIHILGEEAIIFLLHVIIKKIIRLH